MYRRRVLARHSTGNGAVHVGENGMKTSYFAAFAAVFTLASSQLYAQDIAVTPGQLKFNRNPATGSELAQVWEIRAKPALRSSCACVTRLV